MLTLKPLRWADDRLSPEDDYEVLDEQRKVIGRIYLANGIPAGSPPWFWGLARGGPNCKGHEHSREEAMEAFKRAWNRD